METLCIISVWVGRKTSSRSNATPWLHSAGGILSWCSWFPHEKELPCFISWQI